MSKDKLQVTRMFSWGCLIPLSLLLLFLTIQQFLPFSSIDGLGPRLSQSSFMPFSLIFKASLTPFSDLILSFINTDFERWLLSFFFLASSSLLLYKTLKEWNGENKELDFLLSSFIIFTLILNPFVLLFIHQSIYFSMLFGLFLLTFLGLYSLRKLRKDEMISFKRFITFAFLGNIVILAHFLWFPFVFFINMKALSKLNRSVRRLGFLCVVFFYTGTFIYLLLVQESSDLISWKNQVQNASLVFENAQYYSLLYNFKSFFLNLGSVFIPLNIIELNLNIKIFLTIIVLFLIGGSFFLIKKGRGKKMASLLLTLLLVTFFWTCLSRFFLLKDKLVTMKSGAIALELPFLNTDLFPFFFLTALLFLFAISQLKRFRSSFENLAICMSPFFLFLFFKSSFLFVSEDYHINELLKKKSKGLYDLLTIGKSNNKKARAFVLKKVEDKRISEIELDQRTKTILDIVYHKNEFPYYNESLIYDSLNAGFKIHPLLQIENILDVGNTQFLSIYFNNMKKQGIYPKETILELAEYANEYKRKKLFTSFIDMSLKVNGDKEDLLVYYLLAKIYATKGDSYLLEKSFKRARHD